MLKRNTAVKKMLNWLKALFRKNSNIRSGDPVRQDTPHQNAAEIIENKINNKDDLPKNADINFENNRKEKLRSIRRDGAGRFLVSMGDGLYSIKSANSPFWMAMHKLKEGTFSFYKSITNEWHVFRILEGPEYGRGEFQTGDLSVIVSRVSSGQIFIMPADRLAPCEESFCIRDGTTLSTHELESIYQYNINYSREDDLEEIRKYILFVDYKEIPKENFIAEDLSLSCHLYFSQIQSKSFDVRITGIIGGTKNGWPTISYLIVKVSDFRDDYAIPIYMIDDIVEAKNEKDTTEGWILRSGGLIEKNFGRPPPTSSPRTEFLISPPREAIISIFRTRDTKEIIDVAIDKIITLDGTPIEFSGYSKRARTPNLRGWSGIRKYSACGYNPSFMPIEEIKPKGDIVAVDNAQDWLRDVISSNSQIQQKTHL